MRGRRDYQRENDRLLDQLRQNTLAFERESRLREARNNEMFERTQLDLNESFRNMQMTIDQTNEASQAMIRASGNAIMALITARTRR
jgi:hypothetical protein